MTLSGKYEAQFEWLEGMLSSTRDKLQADQEELDILDVKTRNLMELVGDSFDGDLPKDLQALWPEDAEALARAKVLRERIQDHRMTMDRLSKQFDSLAAKK